ncbi:MAG: hypothetical protein PARBA_01903 [Parabacteroides sp.]
MNLFKGKAYNDGKVSYNAKKVFGGSLLNPYLCIVNIR